MLKAGDAETLLALVHDRPLPAEPSARIMEALAFFEKRIKQIGPDVSALCAGLRKLRIVAFQLKEGEDNPHRIFETMNTCGRDLTCADMIGNFILMPLDRERQERLYADHLRPIERGFERHGEEHFDVFIRDFLTLRTGEVPKQGRNTRPSRPMPVRAGSRTPVPRRSAPIYELAPIITAPWCSARKPMRSSHWPLESSPAST